MKESNFVKILCKKLVLKCLSISYSHVARVSSVAPCIYRPLVVCLLLGFFLWLNCHILLIELYKGLIYHALVMLMANDMLVVCLMLIASILMIKAKIKPN